MKNLKILNKKVFIALLFFTVAAASFLRLYKLDTVPPSLYWDEISLGYDAYSILKTGKDHHGHPFPFLAFVSYGDYKPSGYFYAIVPFMAVLGPTELAVRLPSAIAGVATVVGMGLLIRYLSEQLWPKLSVEKLRFTQLVGTAVATMSAWLLQFSRGGWEVNLASSLLLWAVICGLYSRTSLRKNILRITSIILAALTMYIYHATRVVAPAVLLGMFCLWLWDDTHAKPSIQHLMRTGMTLLLPGLFFLLLAGPVLLSSRDKVTQQRFAETSITAKGEYVQESNRLRELSGDSFISKAFTHRYLILSQQILQGYAKHFSVDFLFISGDQNPRHSTGVTGIFVLPDVIWLLCGVIAMSFGAWKYEKMRVVTLFLLWWIVVGVFPAAITEATPHALRILPTAPVYLSVVILGFISAYFWTVDHFPHKIAGSMLAVVLLGIGVYWLSYWRFYMNVYPKKYASEWQYGYKEMVGKVEALRKAQPEQSVFITREFGRPAMNYWFYSQTPPQDVQAEEQDAPKDQAEFLAFQNISFINTVNEAKPGIVVSSLNGYEQLSSDFSSVQKLDEVKDLQGKTVWVLSQVGATESAQPR